MAHPSQTSPSGIDYRVFATRDALARAAAEQWIEAARDAVAARGRFSVALAGGSTPRLLYSLLADEPWRDRVDWQKVRIFFGDERAVGPEHAESNYRMAREALLDRVPLEPDRIHRMEGEAEDLQSAAARYAATMAQTLDRGERGVPVLDLVLLGMGADGHTASLFPATAALGETERAVVANEVPRLLTRRLTLTFRALNAARVVRFLIAGEDKAERVKEILENRPRRRPLPAGRVRPESGNLVWLLDATAAGGLALH